LKVCVFLWLLCHRGLIGYVLGDCVVIPQGFL
jgi:hypothetical protein